MLDRIRERIDPIVRLVPDAYFFVTRGYQSTRSAVAGAELPRWEDRQALVFWRGTATFNPNPTTLKEPSQIPRIALCLRLKRFSRADVGIRAWEIGFPEPAVVEHFIEANSISGTRVPMLEHANYKFQIDIDGVANAWGFFDKLLMGSCILKVQSAYEQWFYADLRAWEHYVPIKADLSDLETQVDWCFEHDADAKAIGQRGQEFALDHTYERGVAIGREAIAASFINL